MRNTTSYIVLIILAVWSLSFEWPVTGPKLTSSFAESRGDHFHDGVDVISSDDKIRPVDKGTLLYYWDKAIFPMENYPGSGNYKVLKHRANMYSMYLHLEDGLSGRIEYSPQDLVGLMGNTGHSYSKHLHLALFNMGKKISANPLLYLPSLEDKKAPEIFEMALRIEDKIVILKDGVNIRLTQNYPLLVKIMDSASGREKLGIAKISAVFNNKQVLDLDLSRLAITPSGLAAGKKRFEDIYDEAGYYKITGIKYSEGENTLRVTTSDFVGNTVEKTFTVNVRLDMQK